MSDDRPKCQLRVTREESCAFMRAFHAPLKFEPLYDVGKPLEWTVDDARVHNMIKKLAPDLADEVGQSPMIFDLVIVEPSWLLTTGEVKRWTKDPIPKEKR